MKITSFEQAKECLKDLRDFLDYADSAISGVSALKGATKQQELVFKPGSDKPPQKASNGSEPEGWTDGVLKLLEAADKPLRAVEVLERWHAAGWSHTPERRAFYIGINGGLQYLVKKQLVEKSEGKYTIKP